MHSIILIIYDAVFDGFSIPPTKKGRKIASFKLY